MKYPLSVEELLGWEIRQDRDSFGTFTIITGFEGTGRCFWCGEEIDGRRRYCGHRAGCWTLYQQHFAWVTASREALRRADFRCENCGCEEKGVSHGWDDIMTNLRVHHIIPLNGRPRAVSVFNIFWNLIVLCHRCHLEIHTVMRELAKPGPVDDWDLARARGQTIMEVMAL